MGEKIDRFSIQYNDSMFSMDNEVSIIDRLDNGIRVCIFCTDNKKLNKELAEYCLERINQDGLK